MKCKVTAEVNHYKTNVPLQILQCPGKIKSFHFQEQNWTVGPTPPIILTCPRPVKHTTPLNPSCNPIRQESLTQALQTIDKTKTERTTSLS